MCNNVAARSIFPHRVPILFIRRAPHFPPSAPFLFSLHDLPRMRDASIQNCCTIVGTHHLFCRGTIISLEFDIDAAAYRRLMLFLYEQARCIDAGIQERRNDRSSQREFCASSSFHIVTRLSLLWNCYILLTRNGIIGPNDGCVSLDARQRLVLFIIYGNLCPV